MARADVDAPADPQPPRAADRLSPAGDRLLGWPRVRDRVDISRTTAWRLERRGEFPRSVQISPGRVAWREGEIEAWKASRAPRAAGPPIRQKASAPRPATPPPVSARPDPPPAPGRAGAEPPGPAAPARKRRHKPVAEGQTAFDF